MASCASPEQEGALANQRPIDPKMASVGAPEHEAALAMLGDLDVHVAEQQNELRAVHAAAAAQTAELRGVQRRLVERTALVEGRDSVAGRLRSTLRSTALAAEMASEQASHAASSSARVLDACASARTAYADLHRHARAATSLLASELAASREAQHKLQSQLVETGLLLLQTHAALGTRLDKASKLRQVRDCLLALSEAPAAGSPRSIAEVNFASLRLTEPLELEEDGAAESSLAASRAAVAAAAAAQDARTAAALTAPYDETDEIAGTDEADRRAGESGSGAQRESAFLYELAEALEQRRLMDATGRAAFHKYEAVLASGTSLLLRPPVTDRWVSSGEERARRQHLWEEAKARRATADKAEAEARAREEGRVQRTRYLEAEIARLGEEIVEVGLPHLPPANNPPCHPYPLPLTLRPPLPPFTLDQPTPHPQ
jgi:hypothetical protein